MTENRKFILGKEPFIRKADSNSFSTSVFMKDFMIALLPLIIFAWIKNGIMPFIDKNTNFLGMIYPLLLVIIGGTFSWLLEFLWYKFIMKDEHLKERMAKSYAPIPGLLLAMIVPLATPIWALLLGVFFATVIGKLMFGGFGHNIFNPALLGYLFLIFSFITVLRQDFSYINAISYFNGTEKLEIISGVTPLTAIQTKFDRITGPGALIEQYGLFNFFIGFIPGSLAETSALLCLISLVYLIVRKVISWRIPVIYLGTVFVLTYIIGAFNGYATTLNFALFHLFSGGLMFGAVFMATEPVTSPRNPNGKIIYALGLGALTVVFRFASTSPEGVAASILIMNMFTAIIERVSAKVRVESNKRKVFATYALIGLLLFGIGIFPVAKHIPVANELTITLDSKEQDFETLDFVYKFTVNGEEVVVKVDKDYKITNISNPDYNSDEFKENFTTRINEQKVTDFVIETEFGTNYTDIVVQTKGYGTITTTIRFDENQDITSFTPTGTESYKDEYNEAYDPANGDPMLDTPTDIITNQDDLTAVEIISGATYTTNGLINAAKLAKSYIEYLASDNTLKFVSVTQDFETLEFVYTFRKGLTKILVYTDSSYSPTSDIEDSIEQEVTSVISENKINGFIESVNGNVLTIKTKGYSGKIVTSQVTIDPTNKRITAITTDTSNQTYDDEYNSLWNGQEPDQVMPGRIIDGQENLDNVEIVTGATVTSKAIIDAAKIAKNYLEVNNE